MVGRIVKIISNSYSVSSKDKIYNCIPRGKFRYEGLTPLVGDIVDFDENTLTIEHIHERKNELKRPEVANIDICIIVATLTRPEFSSFLLDKMVANVTLKDIKPIICLTKSDLLSEEQMEEFKPIIEYYNNNNPDTALRD